MRKNFRNFQDYLKDLKKDYKKEFEDIKKHKNICDCKEKFKEKLPYISGYKTIQLSSIQIPDKQFFMRNIFKEIISSFINNQTYPGENKCGLAYFYDEEWIYYTIEEVFYEKYIEDSKKIMFKLYKDFMENELKAETLFTENDKYILPSSVSGYSFERKATKFFEMKTGLTTLPDLIIKLSPKNFTTNINPDKECTFDEYFKSIVYNYIEIDGAFINRTKKDIIIENNDNAIIPYKKNNS